MKNRKKQAARRQRAASEEATTLHSVLKSALLALPLTAGIGLLLILLATAILLTTKNPGAWGKPMGLMLLYFTALCGGGISARLHARRAPLLCGVAEGGMILLLFLLLSLFPIGESGCHTGALSIGLHVLLLPAASLGACLAAREPKKRRHARH